MRSSLLFGAMAMLSGSADAATFVEDFTNIDRCDLVASTGICNTVAGHARAAAFAGGSATRPMPFGDGSDGDVVSSSGYTFNTDAKPVYQFRSLRITGGSITVTGKNPLVIRSLGAVELTPGFSVKGGNGQPGSTVTLTTAPAGGAGVAGGAFGGAGGPVTGGVPQPGSTALFPDAVTPDGTAGATAIDTSGQTSTSDLFTPDYDTGPFPIFAGAGSGGGARTGGIATGAGGGAGGGFVRISAIGAIVLGSIDASGGAGGTNAGTNPNCSGYGGPGNGGGVWAQSLTSVSGNEPIAPGGTVTANCGAAPLPATEGTVRADRPGGAGVPGWVNVNNLYFESTTVPAGQTPVIQSRAIDLHTLNAVFTGPPVVSSTLNGGTVTVTFAGSADGVTFSADTADPTTLSYQGYRYLRWRIAMTTAAGASPTVTRIEVPYTDEGVPDLALGLGFGCGTLSKISRDSAVSKRRPPPGVPSAAAIEVTLLFILIYTITALQRVSSPNTELT